MDPTMKKDDVTWYVFLAGFLAFVGICMIMDSFGPGHKTDRELQGKIQDRMTQ